MNTEEKKQQYTKEDFNFSLNNYSSNKEVKNQKQEYQQDKFDDSLKNYHPNKGEYDL